ncbi:MarR family winged helix-turn-helix transcriptional regulator [Deinococcus maricopensis]|uniref:Regulatory protein MarR n=1 Tax=Deinococcus maricopensis (strain DSM 21211 / LMG 22137 / NRRL B-23946 / LB-34) TaxID=709986 RepID=E8U357_DEIML|nr:MarR family transcriptional regulator [Deinococcus maricopensis]ADV66002.1 regulatory protein MarR [Deinococcus maricopensis DSM 21211]
MTAPTDLEQRWQTLDQEWQTVNRALEHALQQHHNLSVSEYKVLAALEAKPDHHHRMQVLADLAGLSQSATTRLVARLEAQDCGLLARYLCDTDRRGVYTEITPAGLTKLARARATLQHTLEALWTPSTATPHD